ncbi:MAG: hypothetical protein H6672_10655 [Anaerolineaceae bacterium]|nr:hypothetical protein [Anaerolineaceae bacterium]
MEQAVSVNVVRLCAAITPSKPPTTGCVETVRLRPETAKTQSSQQAGMVVMET